MHQVAARHIDTARPMDNASSTPPSPPSGPMTRSRAKALHDKVNSFLYMCDLDPTVDGTLPHANAPCILRFEPLHRLHGGMKDGREDGQASTKKDHFGAMPGAADSTADPSGAQLGAAGLTAEPPTSCLHEMDAREYSFCYVMLITLLPLGRGLYPFPCIGPIYSAPPTSWAQLTSSEALSSSNGSITLVSY